MKNAITGVVTDSASTSWPTMSVVPARASTATIAHWQPAYTAFPANIHAELQRSEASAEASRWHAWTVAGGGFAVCVAAGGSAIMGVGPCQGGV